RYFLLSRGKKVKIKERRQYRTSCDSTDSDVHGIASLERVSRPRNVLLRQDLGQVGKNRFYRFVVEASFLEGVVRFDGQLGIQDDCHFRLRGDVITFGTVGLVDSQNAMLNFLLLGQFL